MKRLLLLIFASIFVLGTGTIQAQSSLQPWALDLTFGSHSYDGDLGNEFLGTSESDFLWSMGLSRYLSSSFDLSFSFSKMELDHANGIEASDPALYETRFSTDNFNMNLMGRFKFNNGSIMREDIGVKPYIMAGIGVNALKHQNGSNSSAFEIPFGAGVTYNLSEKIGLNYQFTYHRTFSDEIDTYPSSHGQFATQGDWPRRDFDGKDHDDFLTHTIGIVLRFGGEDQASSRERMHRQMMEEMRATRQAAEGAHSASQESRDISRENRSLNQRNVELNEQTLQALQQLKEDCQQSDQMSEELRDQLLNIINNIQFAYDSSDILENSYDDLDLLAEVMKQYTGLRVRIRGHADPRGSEEYNMELSRRRAQAVYDYLSEQGVSAARMSTEALGENSPELQGNDETAHAQNRYVELVFSYAGGSN